MKEFDVLIVGRLAGNDLAFAEHLTRRGLKCCVARPEKARDEPGAIKSLTEYHREFGPDDIRYFGSPWAFASLARRSRLIISFTGYIISSLRWLWFARRWIGLPPVVNIMTGADITELAVERSPMGIVYRQHLRHSSLNWCTPYPHYIKSYFALRIPNAVFLRYPYYLPDRRSGRARPANADGVIRFFHGSNLDWKHTDNKPSRNTAKGNDRFLRALGRAVAAGLDAHCTLLDRGPDRHEARRLVDALGLSSRVTWLPHLDRDALMRQIEACDVVVDQFDVGGFGGFCVEAMALGKPVMIYLNEECMRIAYPEMPPVLNCRTEEEILERVMECGDRARLDELGRGAERWIREFHSWENCLDQFLFYYTVLTGHRVVDYGY